MSANVAADDDGDRYDDRPTPADPYFAITIMQADALMFRGEC